MIARGERSKKISDTPAATAAVPIAQRKLRRSRRVSLPGTAFNGGGGGGGGGARVEIGELCMLGLSGRRWAAVRLGSGGHANCHTPSS